ncbi:MAG: acetyltransferase [Pseudomonadota bacterium]
MATHDAPLVIVGASGWGKEVAWLAKRANFEVKGFLDDDPCLQEKSFYNLPVLGHVQDWPSFPYCQLLVAIAAPRVRKRVVEQIKRCGSPRFATLIDPDASVDAELTKLGEGSVVCAGTVVTADVKIGEHVIINKLCSVGHDVVLESFSTLAPKVMLGGHVHIHAGAEVGASSAVRQGVEIGTGAMVGMGSLVLKDIEPNCLIVGSPAATLRRLEDFNA